MKNYKYIIFEIAVKVNSSKLIEPVTKALAIVSSNLSALLKNASFWLFATSKRVNIAPFE